MSDHPRLHHPVPRGTQWLPSCRICNDPVLLETSKTDEHGQLFTRSAMSLISRQRRTSSNDIGSVPGPADRYATYQHCEVTTAEDRDSPISRQPAVLATMLMQQAKHVSWHTQPWGVDLAAVVTVLVLTCWIAYSDGHPASFLGSLDVQRSVAVDEQVRLRRRRTAPSSRRCQFQWKTRRPPPSRRWGSRRMTLFTSEKM
jgi:hypothetical protein